MSTRESEIKLPDNDTCQWLTANPTFKEWEDAKGGGLLWLRGKPGCGKSTLMKHLLHRLPGADHTCTISFFISSGDELQRTRLGLMRSLVHQLASRFPQAFESLMHKFERARALLPAGQRVVWIAQELFDALIKAVPTIIRTHSLRIFVDAVDECDEGVARSLVQDLRKLVDKSLSSKGEPGHCVHVCISISPYLSTDPFPSAFIQVDEQNTLGVERWVRRRLFNYDRSCQDLVITRAEGLFLSATIFVEGIKLLGTRDSYAIQQAFCTIPAGGIASLLKSVFQNIVRNLRQAEASQALSLLRWACFSTRPLSLAEVRLALAFDIKKPHASAKDYIKGEAYERNRHDEFMESWIRTATHGLVEITVMQNRRVVHPIHRSVKDFLISDGLESLSAGAPSHAPREPNAVVRQTHLFLGSCCIRYLVLAMKETGWDKDANRSSELQLVSYAGSAWARHIALADVNSASALSLLELLGWPSESLLAGFYQLSLPVRSGPFPSQEGLPGSYT